MTPFSVSSASITNTSLSAVSTSLQAASVLTPAPTVVVKLLQTSPPVPPSKSILDQFKDSWIAIQFKDSWNANPLQTIGILIALFIGFVVIIKILFFRK